MHKTLLSIPGPSNWEYSLRLQQDGNFTLYCRLELSQPFAFVGKGDGAVTLARYCQMHGVDGLTVHTELLRVDEDLAQAFLSALN